MTPDRKCIVRGHSKYNMVLCTVDEKSKFKIRYYRHYKNITDYTEYYKIRVTEEVKKLYNLDSNMYNKEKMGELIGVKVKAYYEIDD